MQTPFSNFDQQTQFDLNQEVDSLFALKEQAQILTAANRQRMILRANEDVMISDLRNAR
jgi:hypothetical protein